MVKSSKSSSVATPVEQVTAETSQSNTSTKVKQVKSKSVAKETPVAEVKPSEPVAEVKAKVARVKKSPVATPVVEPTTATSVESAPAADASSSAAQDSTGSVAVDMGSRELHSKLQKLNAIMSEIRSEFRTLEKKWARELKSSLKVNAKRKRHARQVKPSGFVVPAPISLEMAVFLGKTPDTKMSRTEVTKEINGYIRLHNLQNKENKRIILADAPLSTLLKVMPGDVLNYFNLQRYLKIHFPKAVPAPLATSVSV